jgi:hypothetical protein
LGDFITTHLVALNPAAIEAFLLVRFDHRSIFKFSIIEQDQGRKLNVTVLIIDEQSTKLIRMARESNKVEQCQTKTNNV